MVHLVYCDNVDKKVEDWLIIDKIEDVLVGTSIPYN